MKGATTVARTITIAAIAFLCSSATSLPVTFKSPSEWGGRSRQGPFGSKKPPKPQMKDGKPVEVFTYFFYVPGHPNVVVTDLDKPLDKQP